eukprot:c23753_g1_i1 orf=372-2159(-)
MIFAAGARHWRHHFGSFTWRSLKAREHHRHLLVRCRAAAFSSSASMESVGGLASDLWNKNRLQAMMALYHPFVVSLAAGVLDIRSFQHYIVQDGIFLQTFATSYQLAQDNVDDEMSKSLINQLKQAVVDELKLYSSYVEAWGVEVSTDSKPTEATLKYKEFLLRIAAGKESTTAEDTSLGRRKLAAFTIGAMTPCMRLYAFLGQEIAKHMDEKFSDSPYHKWVDTYSAESFEASALQVEQLLESLAAHLGEDDILKLESIYSQAMDLELIFFSGQPYCQCTLLPFIRRQSDGSDLRYLLMADFDLTCSVTDSCSALANVSIRAAIEKEQEQASRLHQKTSSELKRRWDILEKNYSEQYSRVLNLPENQENCDRSYDAGGLRSFLEQLSEFEIQSNSEVVKKGIFEGINLEEVRRAGGEMALQEGCSNFFRQVSSYSNVDAHIISVCWSKSFIEGAMSKEGIDFMKVHSNELSTSGSCTSGDLIRVVETPLDKERVFETLMKNAKGLSSSVRSIYIGDTVIDLVCLLKADLGIVIGSNPTLRRVTKAFGVSLMPLLKGVLEKVKLGGLQGEQHSGVLYTVTSWHEIHAFLIGLSDP